MKVTYQITIEEIVLEDGEKYPKKEEIYTQVFTEKDFTPEHYLDIMKAIYKLNK